MVLVLILQPCRYIYIKVDLKFADTLSKDNVREHNKRY